MKKYILILVALAIYGCTTEDPIEPKHLYEAKLVENGAKVVWEPNYSDTLLNVQVGDTVLHNIGGTDKPAVITRQIK